MKERPILFSGPMVRALLSGSKTQTRRVVKPQPTEFVGGPGVTLRDGSPAPLVPLDDSVEPYGREIVCPYGQPGDRLWVRETFFAFGRWETRFSTTKGRDEWHFVDMTMEAGHQYAYPANGHRIASYRRTAGVTPTWWKRPAIFMPRWASRITLEVTSVRVERLQDISEADALAEGVTDDGSLVTDLAGNDRGGAFAAFATLWEVINGADSWDDNPWVWVVEFRRLT